ncbi:hypothetical protein BKA62DRAFT_674736 [Auriculariales sp. MPI-PUGE-AT-0066]|nr:hypothetical protein BKA62DRAFT_674736 [Auriculariales sp. MPI-PUGE-AT-0066]
MPSQLRDKSTTVARTVVNNAPFGDVTTRLKVKGKNKALAETDNSSPPPPPPNVAREKAGTKLKKAEAAAQRLQQENTELLDLLEGAQREVANAVCQCDGTWHELEALRAQVDRDGKEHDSVARPPKLCKTGGVSLQSAMGLDGQNNKYNALLRKVKIIGIKHLNTKKTFPNQTPRALASFADAVGQEVSYMRRFINNWASEMIMIQYMQHLCKGSEETYDGDEEEDESGSSGQCILQWQATVRTSLNDDGVGSNPCWCRNYHLKTSMPHSQTPCGDVNSTPSSGKLQPNDSLEISQSQDSVPNLQATRDFSHPDGPQGIDLILDRAKTPGIG